MNEQLASTQNVSAFMPYSPSLRHILKSYGASLLLIYLERERQDSFVLDIGRTIALFQVSRGRFMGHLWMIAVGWRSQRVRTIGRKAGREFVTKATRGTGSIKPYCYVRLDKDHIHVYRNKPRVQQLLAQAGLIPSTGNTEMCASVIDEMDGIRPRLLSFDEQIREHTKEFAAQVIDPINDGRSRPGIVRKAHTRRPWTEERRAKHAATVQARSVGKRISSDVVKE
jgi:hypothetical protein